MIAVRHQQYGAAACVASTSWGLGVRIKRVLEAVPFKHDRLNFKSIAVRPEIIAPIRRVSQNNTVRRFAVTASLATAILLSYSTTVALQDVTSMVQAKGGDDRWMTTMVQAGAGSTHEATLKFAADPIATGSVAAMPGGLAKPSGGIVALESAKAVVPETPDEKRVNRGEKTGRLVSVAPTAPPKAFTAGSVLHRESSLMRPAIEDGVAMVFEKSEIRDEAIEIAAAFHKREAAPISPQVPTAIASLVTNDVPDILATAYAPAKPDFSRESPFSSLLKPKEEASGRFIPPAPLDDHEWVHNALPAGVFSEKEQRCLAIGIYFEARGEPAKGQAAVSQVILNRVRNPTFPNTICGVVYQNSHWRNRCQFSFTCDGIKDRVNSPRHWKLAQDIAMATTAGKIWLDEIGSSTHYHATYVNPRWGRSMKRLTRIGLHIFYRTYNGGWS